MIARSRNIRTCHVDFSRILPTFYLSPLPRKKQLVDPKRVFVRRRRLGILDRHQQLLNSRWFLHSELEAMAHENRSDRSVIDIYWWCSCFMIYRTSTWWFFSSRKASPEGTSWREITSRFAEGIGLLEVHRHHFDACFTSSAKLWEDFLFQYGYTWVNFIATSLFSRALGILVNV